MGISVKAKQLGAQPDGSGAGGANSSHELGTGILRIFNQAYAVGRRDVARALIDALDVCLSTATDADTQAAACKARLWIAFVHARDGYMSALTQRGVDHADTLVAARRMRESYLRWCDGDDAPG
jgi:hypothetical protein